MIFVTEQSTLAAALGRVASIVDRRQTIPILGNLLLTAAGDQLTIRATNGDMEATETIPAHIGEEGVTTIDAIKLGDVVKSLPVGSQVAFKLGERMAITSGRTRVNLGILPPDHFPQPWDDDWISEFEIPSSDLADMLARVTYAQSTNAAHAYLQGVSFASQNGVLRLAATDTHIVSFVDRHEVGELPAITVPTRVVVELVKLASAAPVLNISVSESKIMVRAGATVVTAKLIDRSLSFPNYERAIPANPTSRAVIDVDALTGAVRRALVASQNAKDSTVRLTLTPGTVSVTARNAEAEAFDEIDAEYAGDSYLLALNPQYLLSILGSAKTEAVEILFGGSNANSIWRETGSDGWTVVLAPQRTGA